MKSLQDALGACIWQMNFHMRQLDCLMKIVSLDFMSVVAKHGRIYPLTVSFEAPSLPLLPLVVAGLSIVGSAGCYRYEMQTIMDFAAQHGVATPDSKMANDTAECYRHHTNTQRWEDEVSWRG
jgi:D-arabinose 1-dehydrogenase-like Zn-dependent alcohol dehydrogenase